MLIKDKETWEKLKSEAKKVKGIFEGYELYCFDFAERIMTKLEAMIDEKNIKGILEICQFAKDHIDEVANTCDYGHSSGAQWSIVKDMLKKHWLYGYLINPSNT